MNFLSHIVLTYVMALLPCGIILAQSDLNVLGPVDLLRFENWYENEFDFFNNPAGWEKQFSALSFDDNLYLINVISNEWNSLECAFQFRLEDELPYENMQYDYNGFFYFDFNLSYKIKALSVSIGIDNILGFNDSSYNIEPILEKRIGVYDEVVFSHESNFLIKTGIAFNF